MKATSSLLVAAACAAAIVVGTSAGAAVPPTSTPPPPPSTAAPSAGPTTASPTAAPSTTTAAPSATTAAPTTTTLPPIPPGVANPQCARVVRPGDSISLIADAIGSGIGALQAENSFGDGHTLHAGDVLDVCVGNDVDDISGASRLRPPTTLIPDADPAAVMVQQEKLNALFGAYGMTPLAVDGRSGRLTRQQLCAARVLLGLPISRSDMAAGSAEEGELLAMAAIPIPPGAPSDGGRWALLDMSCQVLFVGDPTGVRFVFPASTGQAGFETRVVSEASSFRFDPAVDNGGWHDSSEFPAAYDNPVNGNMYKPIYFSNGQAIHGANNVPTEPASKGCVRLTVVHQDELVGWLGLGGAGGPVWSEGTIGLVVSTQGGYLPDP